MKKFYILFFILISLASCGKVDDKSNLTGSTTSSVEVNKTDINTNVSTEKVEMNLNISKLSIVKDEYWSESYSWKYLTWMFLQEYNISNFENDISYTLSWEIYDNHIQAFSKESDFKKEDFLTLFENFKNKNYSSIKTIFEKNEKMVPFHPTCCAFQNYISFQPYKDGLLMISEWWNWWVSYSIHYITYNNWKIYMVYKDLWYFLDAWSGLIIDWVKHELELTWEDFGKKITSYFNQEVKDAVFDEKLNNFKNEIDNLYN